MGMFSSPKLPPVPEGPDYKEIDEEASEERRRRQPRRVGVPTPGSLSS